MNFIRASLVLCLLSCFLLLSSASYVVFNSSTTTITPPFTKSLTLNCSLNITNSTSLSGAVIGRRQAVSTASDVQYITSLVVTRNDGLHIASVTPYASAKAMINVPTLNVSGNIPGSVISNQYGYLQLTWKDPGERERGTYVCEVNAISTQGHSLVFSSAVEVEVTLPTLSDVVDVLQKQQGKIDSLEVDKQNLITKVNILEADKKNLENKLYDLDTEMHRNDNELMLALNRSKHVEHGSITCGAGLKTSVFSDQWPQTIDNFWKGIHQDHVFATPYNKAPIVFLSLRQRDYRFGSGAMDPAFDITVSKVDTKGFTLQCWAHVSTRQHILVNWISHPAQ